jgi:hypothetical protein
LAVELDKTYREVARRLPDNPDVRFEKVKGKEELILTPLDALDEPPSLIQLRKVVAERLPRVELAELVLEVALRTGFTEAFTHLTDRSARTADFALSLCAALLAEACNTGPEPFIRHDTPALRRDRIAWVKQNYLATKRLPPATPLWWQHKIASPLRTPGAAAKSPLQTACVSWFRSAQCTPVPIRSTSVRSRA